MSVTGSGGGGYRPPPLVQQSPQKILAGSSLNFASNLTGSSEITRQALRHELIGRVEYNIDILSSFLRVGAIQADIVDRCITKIHKSYGYDQFRTMVVEKANGSTVFDEHDMYEPLVSDHSALRSYLLTMHSSSGRNV
jgi:hypothetical protein